MAQKNEELLLKDLSSRLSYGVKIHIDSPKYGELIGILYAVYPTEERVIVDELDKAIAPINVRCGGFKIKENKVKPYLRPMSSMTEEEKIESLEFAWEDDYGRLASYEENIPKYIDWLNKKMFDYRGLIEKGLALEAYKGMYNIN